MSRGGGAHGSTCPAAPRAHVSHVGPLVGGGVVLLHRAQALPGRSIVAPHGIQLPCNTHSHGSQCSHSPGDTSCPRAALGDSLNCWDSWGNRAEGARVDSDCQQHKDTTLQLHQKSTAQRVFQITCWPRGRGIIKACSVNGGLPRSGVLSKAH